MRLLDRVFRPWIAPAVRRNAAIDFVAAVLFGGFGGLTTPFIPVMGRRLGASALEVSLLVAAPAIVLLLSLWWVRLLPGANPVRLVVWPQAAGRAMFFLMPLIHAPRIYVAFIVAYNAIASVGMLGYAQVMRSVYPDDVRGRIMAVVRVGMAVAWIAGALAGGQLMERIPFQWVFAAAGVFGLAGALVFRAMRMDDAEPPPARSTFARTTAVLRENPAFRRFLVAFFVFGFGAWLMGPAVPLLLVDVLHATSFQVGLLGAITSAMWLLAYVYWGRMIDRRTAAGALGRIFLIGAISPLIYALATSAWVVQLAGVTEGLTSAGIDLGWLTAILQYAPAGEVRHYLAIYNTLVGVRAATAPFLAGLAVPLIGVRWIFAASVLLMLIGVRLIRSLAPGREGTPSE
ncbi:MAG TPA: MFS transporter [bacterium]|jgi:MFS family permease